MRIAIVGAGAAGLSVGVMLQERGHDVTIFEKENGIGGLCRSHTSGHTFDLYGPHVLGGIPEAVDWIVQSTGLEFVEGQTNNIGWVNGEFVKHPFEDEDTGRRQSAKLWKHDPDKLDFGGLNAQKGRKPGGVSTFRYPAKGGYQAILEAWADRCAILARSEVTLDPLDGLADWDHVIWTAPVKGMHYNRLTTVTLAFEGEPPPYTAIYLPEADIPFHRLSIPSNFAPDNSPEGEWTIQGEITGRAPVCPEWRLADLVQLWGWGNRGRHLNTSVAEYAYPIPDGSSPPVISERLHFHGRTGGHRYLNLDGVVKASMDLVEEICG